MKKLTNLVLALLFGLTINAQTTLVADSILQLSTCAGDDIVITFKTTGSFPLSNKFIAQISNGFGQFNNPIDIGNSKIAFFGQGIILAKLPKTATLGLYKIRVISTNPADTSVVPNYIIITSTPTVFNQIIRTCQNDTVQLSSSILGAQSYLWSTNDTTQSIIARDTGIYTVTTKDALGCKSTVTDTISDSITCVSLPFLGIDKTSINNLFTVFPNPTNGICTIYITKTISNYLSISIVDILGKEVYHLSDNNSATEYKKDIDLEHLAKGIYAIKLNVGSEIKTQKIILE